jgi:hypothetical protein
VTSSHEIAQIPFQLNVESTDTSAGGSSSIHQSQQSVGERGSGGSSGVASQPQFAYSDHSLKPYGLSNSVDISGHLRRTSNTGNMVLLSTLLLWIVLAMLFLAGLDHFYAAKEGAETPRQQDDGRRVSRASQMMFGERDDAERLKQEAAYYKSIPRDNFATHHAFAPESSQQAPPATYKPDPLMTSQGSMQNLGFGDQTKEGRAGVRFEQGMDPPSRIVTVPPQHIEEEILYPPQKYVAIGDELRNVEADAAAGGLPNMPSQAAPRSSFEYSFDPYREETKSQQQLQQQQENDVIVFLVGRGVIREDELVSMSPDQLNEFASAMLRVRSLEEWMILERNNHALFLELLAQLDDLLKGSAPPMNAPPDPQLPALAPAMDASQFKMMGSGSSIGTAVSFVPNTAPDGVKTGTIMSTEDDIRQMEAEQRETKLLWNADATRRRSSLTFDALSAAPETKATPPPSSFINAKSPVPTLNCNQQGAVPQTGSSLSAGNDEEQGAFQSVFSSSSHQASPNSTPAISNKESPAEAAFSPPFKSTFVHLQDESPRSPADSEEWEKVDPTQEGKTIYTPSLQAFEAMRPTPSDVVTAPAQGWSSMTAAEAQPMSDAAPAQRWSSMPAQVFQGEEQSASGGSRRGSISLQPQHVMAPAPAGEVPKTSPKLPTSSVKLAARETLSTPPASGTM